MPQNDFSGLSFEDALTLRGQMWAKRKELKADIKALDELIRPALEGKGEIEQGGYKFVCEMQSGRRTLDAKRLIDDNPGIDLDSYYKVGAPFTKLTITEV